MRTRIALIIMLLALTISANAKIRISGTVTDENNESLAGAVVRLADSGLTTQAQGLTGGDGRFAIEIERQGDYTISISFMGYEDYKMTLDNVEKDIELGQISLTPTAQALEGVTVTASNTMQRIDRQIVVPTELQVKSSNNGVALLRHMQLARINVNTIDNSVKTTTGDDVQLRINGVEADIAEVKALKPGSVARIEYHDMPDCATVEPRP